MAALPLGKLVQQFGPFGLRLNGPAPRIKSACAIQVPGVQQKHSGAELLPTHGMAAARDANGQAFLACLKDRFSQTARATAGAQHLRRACGSTVSGRH